ncbi:MAG TPA: response regulator transcription factor [Thermomicrobiales bacterium]|nr:response regulator transcription factor [Thermomicrobiales bacterium]
MAHILIIEDEHELARLISGALREDGHTTEVIRDGQFAMDRIDDTSAPEPDIILLDLMLPRVDGLTICRHIRKTKTVPIVMLTAKSTELDKVLGLELGADDYLTKPVSLRELQARVSAILRRIEMMRVQSQTTGNDDQLIIHDVLEIDPLGRDVRIGGQDVNLTAKEFDLIYLLASNPGRVFSRTYLLDRLWGDSYSGFERTVDTHIQRLRRKLAGADDVASRIVTLWGVGYKYERPSGSDS